MSTIEHVDPRAERERIRRATEIIAKRMRENAAKFSRRIPEATTVDQWSDTEATVVTDGNLAPNAAPFAYAEHHPLFGDRKHMYRQPNRPYHTDAVRDTAEEAVEEYARVVDDWCEDLGFTED